MSDAVLRKRLIRLAHEHPEFRQDLIPLLKSGDFSPEEIGAAPAPVEGDAGTGTVSDASKPWMKGEFTQQENEELLKKQELGALADGKGDEAPMKLAKIKAAVKTAKSAKEASVLAYRATLSLGETPKVAVEVARKVFQRWKT